MKVSHAFIISGHALFFWRMSHVVIPCEYSPILPLLKFSPSLSLSSLSLPARSLQNIWPEADQAEPPRPSPTFTKCFIK